MTVFSLLTKTLYSSTLRKMTIQVINFKSFHNELQWIHANIFALKKCSNSVFFRMTLCCPSFSCRAVNLMFDLERVLENCLVHITVNVSNLNIKVVIRKHCSE